MQFCRTLIQKTVRAVAVAVLTLSFCNFSAGAQDLSGIINSVGGFFEKIGISDLYKFAKNRDSTFYVSPPGTYDICVSANLMGSRLNIWGRETEMDSKFHSRILSENMVNTTVTVGYKGVALGYTFHSSSKEKGGNDYRFSLSLHGNLLGLDFSYYKIKSFSGYSHVGDVRYEIPYGEPNMKLFLLNTYIVFNHRHYSYPAGINQSYIQKKSSGSLIGGISYSKNSTNVPSVGFGEPSIKINSSIISIGAGYGYNYVPHKNGLLSFSFMPKFVVYDSSFLGVDHYDIKQTFKRPQMTYSANVAAVKWFGPFRVAVSALTDGYTSHKTSYGFHILQNQWQLHAHLGVNF